MQTQNPAIIPCPPATARVGWTVYERGTGQVLGWIRRTDDSETRPAGAFFTIPRYGPGDTATYLNVRHAGLSPLLTKEV